ncbi:hypothetical protein ACOME3_004239 [Neoechinorhynchus agilis]
MRICCLVLEIFTITFMLPVTSQLSLPQRSSVERFLKSALSITSDHHNPLNQTLFSPRCQCTLETVNYGTSEQFVTFHMNLEVFEGLSPGVQLLLTDLPCYLKNDCIEMENSFQLCQLQYDLFQLITTKSLDREGVDRYSIELCTLANEFTVIADISVKDVNDNAPECMDVNIFVRENQTINSIIGKVTAIDNDECTQSIKYHMDSHEYFEIDPQNGYLRLINQLDFETQRHFEFVVKVTDSGPGSYTFNGYCTININVLNVNDNSPQIHASISNDTIHVKEDFPVGNVLFNVTIVDADIPENIGVKIQSDVFGLHETENRFIFLIVLTKPLDREVLKEHHILVSVHDEPFHCKQLEFNVVVDDVNDNHPSFEFASRVFSVYRSEIDQFSPVIDAVDVDEGENAELEYEVYCKHDFVKVKSSNGQIQLLKERISLNVTYFVFTVVAKDRGTPQLSSKCQIEVQIIDSHLLSQLINFEVYMSSQLDSDVTNAMLDHLIIDYVESKKSSCWFLNNDRYARRIACSENQIEIKIEYKSYLPISYPHLNKSTATEAILILSSTIDDRLLITQLPCTANVTCESTQCPFFVDSKCDLQRRQMDYMEMTFTLRLDELPIIMAVIANINETMSVQPRHIVDSRLTAVIVSVAFITIGVASLALLVAAILINDSHPSRNSKCSPKSRSLNEVTGNFEKIIVTTGG